MRDFFLDFLPVVNFLTDPGSPAIKFLKTGLTYSHILTKNSKIKKRSDFLDIWIFQYFGNFSTDPGSPAIKFFRTGLTYAFIFT